MESLGEELADRFGVPPPRVLMQGGKLRALEFKFPLPVSLRRARELSQAASEREVLIEPDRPGRVQLLVDAAPAPAAADRPPARLRIDGDGAAPELVRRLYAVFEGITVYENEGAAQPELHVEGVRKLFVNRTQRALQSEVQHAEVRENGTLVLRVQPATRKRKRSD